MAQESCKVSGAAAAGAVCGARAGSTSAAAGAREEPKPGEAGCHNRFKASQGELQHLKVRACATSVHTILKAWNVALLVPTHAHLLSSAWRGEMLQGNNSTCPFACCPCYITTAPCLLVCPANEIAGVPLAVLPVCYCPAGPGFAVAVLAAVQGEWCNRSSCSAAPPCRKPDMLAFQQQPCLVMDCAPSVAKNPRPAVSCKYDELHCAKVISCVTLQTTGHSLLPLPICVSSAGR